MSTARPLARLAAWLGGWTRLLLLTLALAAVAGGLLWEQWRHPPVPPGALQVTATLNADMRQTAFRHPGPAEAVRAFYQQALPPRGWSYCGTQATPGCSKLTPLAGRPPAAVEVYRRADDRARRGPTVEIWPIQTDAAQIYVTVYETQGQ